MKFSLDELLILFVSFQLLIFSVIILLLNRKGRINLFFLSLFFLALSLNIFNLFLYRSPETISNKPLIHLLYIGSPFAYLYAPAFFYFIVASTVLKFRFRIYDLVHFLPFIALFTYIILSYTILDTENKSKILQNGGLFKPGWHSVLVLFVHIQILTYFITSVGSLRLFRKIIVQTSSSDALFNLHWMKSIIWALICLWLTDLVRYISFLGRWKLVSGIEVALFLGFIIFSGFFIYKALKLPPVQKNHLVTDDHKKYSLSKNSRDSYLRKLISHMEKEKPYLDPELTIISLSERCGIPVRSLSEVINSSFGNNFYDFVNMYRVGEAERIFRTSDASVTILEVLYDVGFNSKSSFNKAFKKYTGMTPTEYRFSNQKILFVNESYHLNILPSAKAAGNY